MLTDNYLETLVTHWRASKPRKATRTKTERITVERGLTESELRTAEAAVGAPFPPDLRALLSFALPSGLHFPDWRRPNSKSMRGRLAWPADGIIFDVEHNDFWLPAWGPRPSDLEQAFELARAKIDEAPRLIPIFSHRYLPATPNEAGNPVFSVYQTDVIYYGFDLQDYLEREFGLPNPEPSPKEPREIRFWSQLEAING